MCARMFPQNNSMWREFVFSQTVFTKKTEFLNSYVELLKDKYRK